VRVSLPSAPTRKLSLKQDIAELLNEIRKFRQGAVTEDILLLIHAVAANPVISSGVISKIKSELPASNRKYFSICFTYSSLLAAFIVLSIPIQKALIAIGYPGLAAQAGSNPLAATVFFVSLFLFFNDYYVWRSSNRDSYIASYLIRALEFGVKYQSGYDELPPTERERLRDCLATSIQRVAVRYTGGYKRSNSTRLFASRVRLQAKKCRNDIISMIPGLVTASREEIEAVTADLARLLIRTQTGYWYQTDDIVRSGSSVPRKYARRIWFSSFITNPAIQVAIIAWTATIAAAITSRPL
jgi:hypothetical protein